MPFKSYFPPAVAQKLHPSFTHSSSENTPVPQPDSVPPYLLCALLEHTFNKIPLNSPGDAPLLRCYAFAAQTLTFPFKYESYLQHMSLTA